MPVPPAAAPMHTVLEAIATGHPPLRRSQQHAAAFMQRVEGLAPGLRKRIPQLYDLSAIGYRQSCIEDYDGRDAGDFTFYPPSWTLAPPPSTGARNRKYREAVVPLAEGVAREALARAGRAPEAVTHVVVASCTGFFAPGLDVELVRRLGLAPTTQRTFIGFMGCYAAFNALRVAHSFCQAQPEAVVLVVCAELCTLHFQVEDSLESAVVNALFSDGAAAAVLAAHPAATARGRLVYAASHALLDDDSMDYMTWDIGDTGFLMGLSSRVPDVIAANLPAYLEGLLAPQGLAQGDVGFWAIHPGGRAIVEKAREVLGLPEEAVADSLGVLHDYGNMSSPTILFVMERFLRRHEAARAAGEPGLGTGVAMAFGPGLTLEGCLWRTA